MQEKRDKSLKAIGWREWVSLPKLDVPWIKAKVDTGARSSALHAFDMEIVRVRGVRKVRFSVHPFQRDSHTTMRAEAELVEERWVKSSSGKRTLRPVVITPVTLFDQSWMIELTLVSRDEMGFRMLLGRQAIRGRFLVDSGRSYLSGKKPAVRPRKKAKRKTPRKGKILR